MCAEKGGGRNVNINRKQCRSWEQFDMIKI